MLLGDSSPRRGFAEREFGLKTSAVVAVPETRDSILFVVVCLSAVVVSFRSKCLQRKFAAAGGMYTLPSSFVAATDWAPSLLIRSVYPVTVSAGVEA